MRSVGCGNVKYSVRSRGADAETGARGAHYQKPGLADNVIGGIEGQAVGLSGVDGDSGSA